MAITNSDGSIILSTKVDTSGMEQGTKSLKSQAAKLAAEYRKAGMSQSEAFKKAWSEIDRTKASTDKATSSTKKFGSQAQKSGRQAKVAFDGLSSTLRSVAGYIAMAFSVTKLVQFGSESSKLATQTEASVQRLIDIYGQAGDAVGDFIDANSRALGMSKAAAASYASVYGNLFSVWADQKTNAELTNHYLNMTAVVASKTGRTVADVQERIRSGLLGNTEAIEDLGIFVNVKTIEITDAFQRIANGRSWEQLTAYEQSQVRTLAILEQSTKKYGTEVANTTQSVRLKFQAAYEDFKNTWGQLVNTILIPVLSTLTKIFSVATAVINTLTGNTGGIMGDSSQADTTGQIKDNIAESTENQKEFTGAIEETNKELKKTLAGFDDLQILSRPSESANEQKIPEIGGGASGGGGGLELPALPQIGQQEQFDPMAIVTKIRDALYFILPVISISLVVIGLILLSAGQIGWGLGFIIGGAYLYSVTERSANGYFDFSVIKRDLDAILPYIDEALVAIGLILMFLGQIPIGIGFIIVGAIVYGVQEVSTSDYTGEDVITKLAAITEAVSLALVAIGIILMFFGNFPLGLGFVVAGAGLLKVSEEKLNESEIQTKIQKFFADFKEYIETAAWAMVALGFVLLLFGNFGLGFALILGGLAIVGVTEAVLDFDALIDKVKDACYQIKMVFRETVNTVIGWLNALGLNIDPLATEEKPNFPLPNDLNYIYVTTGRNPLFKKQPAWADQGVQLPPGVQLPDAVTGTLVPNGTSLTESTNNTSLPSSIANAVNDAISRYESTRNATTEVVLELDGREFGRAVVEQGGIENRRIGTRMVII